MCACGKAPTRRLTTFADQNKHLIKETSNIDCNTAIERNESQCRAALRAINGAMRHPGDGRNLDSAINAALISPLGIIRTTPVFSLAPF
jgi:hypothetical protein